MKALVALSALFASWAGAVAVVGSHASAQPGPCATTDAMVRMGPGTQFLPDVINVAVGGTVCWTNDDFLTHNATSVPPGAFATLRVMRTARTVARIRRTLRPGGNTIRLRVATRLPRGRYLARLTVEGRRYTASVRL